MDTVSADAVLALHTLDSLSDAVIVLDRAWRFTYANPAARVMGRFPGDALPNGIFWDVFPELVAGPGYKLCQRTMRERVYAQFEDYYAPFGLWVEVASHPVPDGIALFVRDITERKRSEERNAGVTQDLGRRLREFETLLEVLPVGIGISGDPACQDIKINQAFSAMLNTQLERNASKSGPAGGQLPFYIVKDGHLVAAEDLPMQLAAREAREVRDVELDIVRADGTIVTELCFARPLFDEQQKVRGSLGVFLDITERRRSESAVRESESRYRFLAEAIPQIVWIATIGNRILYINKHWCEYTGLTLEQTKEDGWAGVIHPDDIAHAVGQAAIGRERNGTYEAEYRLRRASDGTYRWHFARASIAQAGDGSECWMGTAVDIDDRRRLEEERTEALARELTLRLQAEEALESHRRIEQQLLLLVEASSVLIASSEFDRVLATILKLASRFVGADAYAVWRKDGGTALWKMLAAEGLSKTFSDTLSEQIGGLTGVPPDPLYVEDIEASAPLAQRAPFLRAEGTRSLLAVPLRIHGQVQGSIVFYYRVKHRFTETEVRVAGGLANLGAAALGTAELYGVQTQHRLLAESAERRAEFLAEAGKILSSSLDYEATLKGVAGLAVPAFSDWVAVDLVNDEGQIQRVASLHGDPGAAAYHKEFRTRYPVNDSRTIRQTIESGRSRLVEVSEAWLAEKIPDPAERDAVRRLGITSMIVTPLVVAGRSLGALTLARHEPQPGFTGAELALAEELAGRAATAVANARMYEESRRAQAALQKSNSELKRVNEDLNQFAYSASHDLQEPLRMVAIYSQMLASEYAHELSENGQLYVSYAVQGARQMEMLVRDILAYTQAANLSEESLTETSSFRALEIAEMNLAASIGETHALIHAGPLPDLKIQEIHLVQLLQNLIGNALKYRGDEPPDIRVDAQRCGDFWRISVSDNGIGIAPEYKDQIFGIFKRLHSREAYPGTGVGLAICQKIVERYGGRIWVESEEGKGAKFYFTIPA